MPYTIKEVNREYFQRSMFFLYPVLKIPSSVSIKPTCTYLSWENKYDVTDKRLICLFPKIDIEQPMKALHEKKYLLGNSRYENMYMLEDGSIVYVFNLDNIAKDWDHLLEGRYSKLSAYVRLAINDYFRANLKTAGYMDSYLNPDKYYDIYAKLLGVDPDLLREGIELLSKPDMGKEHLTLTYVNSEMSI